MTTPEIGEEVLVVSQTYWYLATHDDPRTLVGRTARAAKKHLDENNLRAPYWWTFEPGFPGWGYGVLVIRDGKFEQGPTDWATD